MTPAAAVVSFVVPVRDDAACLRQCLESIRRSDYPPELYELVVVDNGSRDDSVDVARRYAATVLEIPDLPIGQLRNRGSQEVRGEILAFVDADHEIDPGWIRAAVEVLEDPTVGAVGALCTAPSAGTWVQLAYDSLRARQPGSRDVEWLGSGNLAVRRKTFQQLGGFDTGLETCEDVDLCLRLRAAGHRIVNDGRLRSVHFGDPPTLRRLFLGELWRGRDNLRVSLRGPMSLRGIPSIAIPLVDLGCLVLVAVGVLSFRREGLLLAAVAAGALVGFAGLRAVRMTINSPDRGLLALAPAFAVAIVYDVARALALVFRHRHHRARRG